MIEVISDLNSESPGRRWRKRELKLVLCILVVAGGLFLLRSVDVQLPPSVSRTDYDNAAAEFRTKFGRSGDQVDVLMTLAETAAKKNDSATAIACYQQIPTNHRRYGPSARFEEAQLFAAMDQVRSAEQSFFAFLQVLDQGVELPERRVEVSRRWLSLILAVELRLEDRHRVLHQMMDDHQADVHDLKHYYFHSLLIWQSAFASGRVRDFLKIDPENRLLRTAEARYLVGEGRLSEARERLTVLHRENPHDLRSLAVLLECSYEMNDWPAFSADFATVPEFSKDEPWLLTQLRGEWALQKNDWHQAEKFFRHILEVDPPNAVCLMGLGRAFAGQGKTQEQETVLQRSLLVAKLRVDLATITHDNAPAARSIAHSARQLGMDDAAALFEFFAAGMPSDSR